MTSFRKLIGIMLLAYALICIPSYAIALMQGFNLIVAFNLLLMVLLGGLVTHDLLQDHGPLEVTIETLEKKDEEVQSE
jgi:hypothetical protein